ncbi:Uma2 family endonuclease [Nocardiopsis chromatogenes]|uniref:Uma2 family endonuclease n=1 Tax=Nocardiopsis chromatogenes TaxID=280239 RepID=UPI000345FD94|nr:Uma2 family endonuclease [Nocardiopsis chromatogenes]
MTMELCERPERPGAGLRAAAEHVDVPEGYKVEVLGGTIYVTPAPTPLHNLAVEIVYDQLRDALRDGRRPHAGSSVAPEPEPGEPEASEYAIPDLMVVDRKELLRPRPILPAAVVDAAVEVVSPSTPRKDREVLPEVYARWGIPLYIVIDPRCGAVAVHSGLVEGEFRLKSAYRFSEAVPLPPPLEGITVDTSELPRYPGHWG